MRGPLFAMTMIGREGVTEQRSSMTFWADCLSDYAATEVYAAFVTFAKSGRKFPQPSDIVSIISDSRWAEDQKVLRQVLEQKRQDQIQKTAREIL